MDALFFLGYGISTIKNKHYLNAQLIINNYNSGFVINLTNDTTIVQYSIGSQWRLLTKINKIINI